MRHLSSQRRLRRVLVAVTMALVALLAPSIAHAADGPRSSFLLGVLPDTQFYSRYTASSGGNQFEARYGAGAVANPFKVQTQWLVDHKSDLEIPFVTHLGDVVDQEWQQPEWDVADDAMQVLDDGGLPYSILAGNHDVTNGCEDPATCNELSRPAGAHYVTTFPASRAAAQTTTYGGTDPSGYHTWHTFTAEGRTFLVLALSWQPSDSAIAWARQVLADHPDLPTIVTTHQIINIAGDGVSPLETPASDRLWDELIHDEDQIFLTINGHYHGNAHLRKTNDFGHSVDEIVLDAQMDYMGGNGYLGLIEFDFTHNEMDTTVVSPWVRLKPTDTLVPEFDHAVRNNPNSHLTIPIDWNARFAGFQLPVALPVATHDSLIAAAEAAVLDGYTEPADTTPAAPHDSEDYPHVTGTVAHWRFGLGTAGTVAPGDTVADVSGNGNTLTRVALSGNAQADDVQRVTDHAYTSSDPGALCFANLPGRVSYLETALNAPANQASFPNGYTIETFIKIKDDWQASNGAWVGPLTRDSEGGGDPIMGVAVSNLREIQWISNPIGGGTLTSWSGEVMNGTWLHLVGVNKPDGSLTLYVNGAPVLRNQNGGVGSLPGQDSQGNYLSWLIGASTWAGLPTEGWQGCVGETRLVDHPLASSEWLSARTYVEPEPPTDEPDEPDEPEHPGKPHKPDPKPGKGHDSDPGKGHGTPSKPSKKASKPASKKPAAASKGKPAPKQQVSAGSAKKH